VEKLRPHDRLDRRLDARRLRGRHVRAVAHALEALHASAEVCMDEVDAGPIALAKRLREHADALAQRCGGAVADDALPRLLAAQQRFLTDAVDVLLERASTGRVRRLHGRIACRNIAVDRRGTVRLVAPDPEARGDVAEDVAALAIDLRARGAARRAEAFAAAYAWASDDYALYRVVDGYERDAAVRLAFEASVRAGAGPEPAAYLRAFLDAVCSAPLVIATSGGVATGKSRLAKAVARRLAAPRVAADRVQHALLAPIPDAVAHELVWDRGFGERVYGGMFQRAEAVLASGRSVVLDACFADAERRREAAALAARHGADIVFAECNAPPEVVEARLRRRDRRCGGTPGGWPSLARIVTERWQPPDPGEPGRHLRVDTGRPQSEWLRALEPLQGRRA
jgi:hypothetical protein